MCEPGETLNRWLNSTLKSADWLHFTVEKETIKNTWKDLSAKKSCIHNPDSSVKKAREVLVRQETNSGKTCWKKSCWTWLSENIVNFLLPLIWHFEVYVGLRCSEVLLRHYTVDCETGESGSVPLFN